MTAGMDLVDFLPGLIGDVVGNVPVRNFVVLLGSLVVSSIIALYFALHLLAPRPRLALPSETRYVTSQPSGRSSTPQQLPCWQDTWEDVRSRNARRKSGSGTSPPPDIEPAEVIMSVVIPAYNEEARLESMLEEAIIYLDATYGRPAPPMYEKSNGTTTAMQAYDDLVSREPQPSSNADGPTGYEILLVNDGSRDRTVDLALSISRKHKLHHVLRVITLRENRGKGGAVVHGLRHVRGLYAVFADADGASTFSDLGKLVVACDDLADSAGRAVAIGSRAHMVGSDAVIKRSVLRNALMHAFHLFLRLLTPADTSRIRDTQCGFKLFSRAALPHIVPYMHAEGWIFDVEMLMLAESAPPVSKLTSADGNVSRFAESAPGIRVAEVPITWHEVGVINYGSSSTLH